MTTFLIFFFRGLGVAEESPVTLVGTWSNVIQVNSANQRVEITSANKRIEI